MINNLSLEEKIGQMFMIGFEGPTLPKNINSFINSKNIGGVILFSRNIKSIESVFNLNKKIHSLGKVCPMIWTDQEGGNIIRFSELATTGISHMGIAETNKPENAKIIASLIAEDMKNLGIDGVFAPVLDVNINKNNPVIGIRSFSEKPEKVVEYGKFFIEGLNDKNIASCGKHFPGHGAASTDSHLEIPEISLSIEDFNNLSLFPFLKLSNKLDAIMTAHVKFPNISKQISTFSNELISQKLKNRYKFEGIVFSDCLEMKAIADNYKDEEIVLNSINAGIDIMIVSHSFAIQEKFYEHALKMVKRGEIKEDRINDSVSRILKLKSKYNINKDTYKTQNMIPKIRQHIEVEKKIALSSIKILKHGGNLPVLETSKTLFIEFSNHITDPSVLSNKQISKFDNIIKKNYNNSETVKINLSSSLELINGIIKNLKHYDNLVIFIYSFRGNIKSKLIKLIKNLYKNREDLILISLENPYEIIDFPFIQTFICTFGFREIQVEAVLKTLQSK